MYLSNLDYIQPNTRLKIGSRGISRHKPLPKNWADFARLTEIRSGSGIVPFHPYPYQVSLVDAIESHKLTVVGKSRQLGISETVCNYFLYRACVDRSVLAVVLSLGQRETIDLARRVRFAIESLSPLGITTTTDTLTDIQISGGGRLLFRPSNENSTRGLPAVTHCLLDEAGFVDNVDRIYQAVIPATSTVANPHIVVVSTPNGATGWYYNLLANDDTDLVGKCDRMRDGSIEPYQEWSAGKTSKVLIHWKSHPKFSQQPDYLDRIAQETGLTETVIAQEYNLSFSDQDEAVFPASLIRSAATLEELSKEYREGYNYYIRVDGATVGNDYTVSIVLEHDFKNDSYAVVDIYRKRKASIESDIYKIGELIDKYNPDTVAVESIEYVCRQEGTKDKIIEYLTSGMTTILINGSEIVSKAIEQKYRYYVREQDRAGVVDLASSINDDIFKIDPSLDKVAKRKIASVGSEDELDSNPYISAMLMGIGYLGRASAFCTRNIGTFGGCDRERPRTDDDPEYIADHDRRGTENEYTQRAYSNPNSSYFNGEMGRMMGRRF